MNNRYFIILFLYLFLLNNIQAATPKSVTANKIEKPLVIDAYLDEDVYKNALPATDFVQIQPYNGDPAPQNTKAYFFYDQSALYVGVILEDYPDSIYNYLTERDDTGMSDYFGIYLDPYNKGQMAFGFFVTPAGVQVDVKAAKTIEGDMEDGNWNAVWESKARLFENGWIAEFKIPYSTLRFSNDSTADWGLNMFRNFRRHNSNNSWNYIDRKMFGFIHQQGVLTGINDIKPPVRLSLSPYLATYLQKNKDGKSDLLYKGGLDLKYGISDAFTLDMMLIPDFGQVQSDALKLNLTPYELYYDEKRQFFTEGTEIFKRADVFYSRRIGAAPKFSSRVQLNDNEEITQLPGETQLINATKISGRTASGWGLGFLNAMSLNTNAVISNTIDNSNREFVVQPFTNYNVSVVDKSLPNNSYVSIINTNVSMANNPFYANVTATEFELRDKSMSYALRGKGGFSSRNDLHMENGYYGSLTVIKNKGKVFWGVGQNMYSDKYNPNDMGYLQQNNHLTSEAWIYSQWIEPKSFYQEINADVWINYNRMYLPNTYFNTEVGYDYFVRFKNNYLVKGMGTFNTLTYDYFEPRVPGRMYINPFSHNHSLTLQTDQRKKLNFALKYGLQLQPANDNVKNNVNLVAYFRIGQRFNMNAGTEVQESLNEKGFSHLVNDDIFFVNRKVNTIINSVGSSFVLNNKSGLSMNARHYWTGVNAQDLYLLTADGLLQNTLGNPDDYNVNYNAFSLDVIFRWIFAPGSELSVAWKGFLYDGNNQLNENYWNNLRNSWDNQSGSISLKVLYYLDYHTLFGVKKG